MTSTSKHQFFESTQRVSQSLRNDRCQNILYKAVFEHFIEIKWIAALLLASKSFRNSSFGANFLVNFVVDKDSISLLESVLAPSSCLSLQFVPSLYIWQSAFYPDEINRGIFNFVRELVNTKYLRSSLRSLILRFVEHECVAFFFGSSTSNAWPQLQDLKLEECELNDSVLEVISKSARQLRTVDLSHNSAIIDSSLAHLSNLSTITSLNLSSCKNITDAGLEHVAKLSGITSLDLKFCNMITDVALEHLSKLSSITFLNLDGCDKITDAGLEPLSKLSCITSLNLSGCGMVTDAGLEHISKLSGITALNLSGCRKISNVGIEHISKLSGITDLNLTFCRTITDDGLQQISKLSSMTSLKLTFCRVSGEAKSKLSTVLPNCTING